jgi:hypothetical protein
MKGIVFTEFLSMVDDHFSPEMVERILDGATLPSGGVYTAVGTYDHHEILQLVGRLSQESGVASGDLVRAFGQHLFTRFVAGYPQFFAESHDAFDFLQRIDGYIHMEVRKLYPDAELPRFSYEVPAAGRMILTYRSSRPFADLAEGLIRGCVEHFGGGIAITREDLTPDGTASRFVLTAGA